MGLFAIGSTYALSIALLVYGIQSGIIGSQLRETMLVLWAAAGLVLAFTSTVLNRAQNTRKLDQKLDQLLEAIHSGEPAHQEAPSLR
jgi:hypothetical protein